MPSISFVLKNKKTSLQGECTCTNVKSINSCEQKKKGNYQRVMIRRACCFPSLRGSMTLEASLVLPLFLFAMTASMLFGEMIMIQGRMYHGLVEAVREMAVEEYYYNHKNRHGTVWMARTLQKKYGGEGSQSGAVKIGNVSFAGSQIPNGQDEIELHMSYQISLNYPFIGTKKIRIKEKVAQKAFTGYQPTAFEAGKGYAYVTEYGTVYHTSMQCSHIMLKISDGGEVEKYLNGETKYEPCAKCIKDTAQEIHQLFVAKEGDCYHSSLSCSGLTRLIRKVTIWEVEGMELCSRCGK